MCLCARLCVVLQLSMNQCSDAVWRMASEIMDANKKKDDTLDAVTEKLQMFSHVTQAELQTLADGETQQHKGGRNSYYLFEQMPATLCVAVIRLLLLLQPILSVVVAVLRTVCLFVAAVNRCLSCMLLRLRCVCAGFKTAAPDPQETVGLTSGQAIQVPHELPGQDPEGGSEVNFGDESSEATATPRTDGDLSRRTSDTNLNFHDSRPSTDGVSSRTGATSLAASAAAGAAAAGGILAPGTPETALGAVPVPPRADGGDADGLGGSWQDLQVLRAQSMAQRGSALHYTHVSSSSRHRGAGVGCSRGHSLNLSRQWLCVGCDTQLLRSIDNLEYQHQQCLGRGTSGLAAVHVGPAISSWLISCCCRTL